MWLRRDVGCFKLDIGLILGVAERSTAPLVVANAAKASAGQGTDNQESLPYRERWRRMGKEKWLGWPSRHELFVIHAGVPKLARLSRCLAAKPIPTRAVKPAVPP